ncbi:hypothetical protein DesfrDRAFT_2551 [Solidesulfovibrio fructosivorans JJ]]|uniref:Uncharacterized protein n=1 Tax=Solidesulfovibrio fructosivorans JJ] TaxID=596151 RepID=E1JY52_SOLFR|nr:hypothetical protein [Solidesulfovibrio fructosivorans]EFL50790.1 hypothetical protein DesfrDRAFT_2551 [Solidesulfovibrio fructosivorans JJ]]
MGATCESIAEKIRSQSPVLAACLCDAQNAPLRKAGLEALGKALGVAGDLDKLVEPVSDAANVDKIKAAEEAFRHQLSRLAVVKEANACGPQSELDSINAQDFRSLKKINIYAKWTLSILIVAGFFGVLIAQYWYEPSGPLGTPQAKEQLALLIGALIAAFTSVVQYFFGSSVGSAEKMMLLQNKEPGASGAPQAGNPPAATPPASTPPETP